MLEWIEIHNFQKWNNKLIEFDPKITCLIGETEEGKSAILRALHWVLYNSRSGKSHIRWGAKFCKVKIGIDGHTIQRFRNQYKNSYRLDKQKPSYAFGKCGIPDYIEKILNLTTTNFQRQHDAHFWFALAPGKVSKELNQIISLDIIDIAQASVKQELKQTRSRKELCAERLKEAKEKKNSLRFVKEASNELTKLINQQQQLHNSHIRNEEFKALIAELKGLRNSKIRITRLVEASESVSRLADVASKLTNKASLLSKYIETLKQTDGGLKRQIGNIEPLKASFDKLTEISKRRQRIGSLLDNLKTLEQQWAQAKDLAKSTEQKLGSKCPVCLQKLPNYQISN